MFEILNNCKKLNNFVWCDGNARVLTDDEFSGIFYNFERVILDRSLFHPCYPGRPWVSFIRPGKNDIEGHESVPTLLRRFLSYGISD